jgi:cell wall-associated NlpC family hydrolase
MTAPTRLVLVGLLGVACASPGAPSPGRPSADDDRAAVVRAARAQLGVPYRYGGRSPAGFDCSGLVVYSYAEAGLQGLPHSAAALEAMSQKIPLREIEPGDLLFFRLDGPKTSHVGIYVGNREFVHAPSGGKPVEKVRFDHVYWGEKIRRAGRLMR